MSSLSEFVLINVKTCFHPHTPLNSSIVSWEGDVSYIWNTFKMYEDENLEYYTRGSDEFYYEEIDYKWTYEPVCPSIKNYLYEKPT